MLAACGCDLSNENKSEPDVIFVTTPPRVVKEMLKLAGVTNTDIVYDLGSGDGRIVIAAAKDFGAKGVGIDIDSKLIAEGRENARKAGVSERVTFVEHDVLKADISRATVITLYMLPTMNAQLLPKFYKELQPGTRVVSHRFLIGDWKPDMTLKAHETMIYLWVMPANLHGGWRVTMRNDTETREYRLNLQQTYQELSGFMTDGGREFRIAPTRLYGNELTISVADTIKGQRFLMELDGALKGNILEGTARITDARHPLPISFTWKGVRS
jgi:SAM-dependent methyltransferase